MTVYLADEVHERLDALAAQHDTTLANLVRQAVDRLLSELERAQMPGHGVAESATAYHTRAGAVARVNVRRTTMHFPDDMRRRLAERAELQGESQAELVRQAVDEYLASAERPWPSSIGLGEDEELAGRNVRDWIRSTWIQHV